MTTNVSNSKSEIKELSRKPLSDISVNNGANGCKRPLKSRDCWKFKTNSALGCVAQNYEKENALPFALFYDDEPNHLKVKKDENVMHLRESNSCENVDKREDNAIHRPNIWEDDSKKVVYPSQPTVGEDNKKQDVLSLYPKWSTGEECWQPYEAQTSCDMPSIGKNLYNYLDKEPEKVGLQSHMAIQIDNTSICKHNQENVVCSSWPSTYKDQERNEYRADDKKWSMDYRSREEPEKVSEIELMEIPAENMSLIKNDGESSLEKRSSSENPNDYLSRDFPYKEDNFAHLQSIERKYRPYPDYINFQRDITSEMRKTLVDWMIEVGVMFEYSTECVHLAVSLTDRFLSIYIVSKNKLQLVGITSIFIAAKYEEVNPQELKMYSFITDSTYTKKQILQMEQKIMHILNFYVGAPIAMSFLSLIHCATEAPEKVFFYGQYLCEISLLDIKPFISYLPSLVGVASYFLAGSVLGYNIPEEVLKMTSYDKEDLIEVMDKLHEKVFSLKGQNLQTLTKYSHSDFLCVAEVVHPKHIFI